MSLWLPCRRYHSQQLLARERERIGLHATGAGCLLDYARQIGFGDPPGAQRRDVKLEDDLLDAAVAAWSALQIARSEGQRVCPEQVDSVGLRACIWY